MSSVKTHVCGICGTAYQAYQETDLSRLMSHIPPHLCHVCFRLVWGVVLTFEALKSARPIQVQFI